MDEHSSALIRPYHQAEHHFLQVLLTSFVLRRAGQGTHLTVHLEKNTPAIWSRFAKRIVREGIPDFTSRATLYQKLLDEILLEGRRSEFHHTDSAFPFRYGSGGVLPIIHRKGEDYLCLFYREIHPIGWNIANGGCDSRDELLHPFVAAERELREELIVLDAEKRRWYVFASDIGKPLDHPDFAVARDLWRQRFRGSPMPDEEWPIPLKWLDGPDSIEVHFHDSASREPVLTSDCFLNINALDFGIEVDRVGRMTIDRKAVLLDGEMVDGRVINRPVGLFKMDELLKALAGGATEFFPDIVFYDARCRGRRRNPRQMRAIVAEFLEDLATPPCVRSPEDLQEYAATAERFGLCPVTERIIRRLPRIDVGLEDWDVFLSFASEDAGFAERVHAHLQASTSRKIFFSPHSVRQSDFSPLIDHALDRAACLIAVGSHVRHLKKPWVEYEWRSYFQESLARGHGELVSFISKRVECGDLPRPLRHRTWFMCSDTRRPARDMTPLVETVMQAVKGKPRRRPALASRTSRSRPPARRR
jgi:hypothetical protein